ncbi:hypothetical protein ACMAZF_01770 [Psychrobium sp. nBUS_13]|uniref:hypothetical protein n=1 Tax=Psychrobium sp. nBUS_13 TaxID=3395319 RepID=UPI003EB99C3A
MNWDLLQEKHSALSLREKLLVLITVVFLVFFIGVNFVVEPLYKEYTSLKKQQETTKQSINAIELQVTNIETKLNADPLEKLQDELRLLNVAHDEQVKRLDKFQLSLVASDEMSSLVKALVNENKHLSVLSLKSMPPEAILFKDNDSTKQPLLYRHSMSIKLQGRYFALLDFMKNIEAKNKSVLWSDINYRVEDYPEAIISFEIFTISTDEEFIGVKA